MHKGEWAYPDLNRDNQANDIIILKKDEGILRAMGSKIQIFKGKRVRAIWDSEKEDWYFSAVDVVWILADSKDYQTARTYWKKLKQRLKEEGNETVTNCHQLKMEASDGKMRSTDCLCTEDVLRLVQSIPSRNAEPFKMWLAKVGSERLDEIADPEKAMRSEWAYPDLNRGQWLPKPQVYQASP